MGRTEKGTLLVIYLGDRMICNIFNNAKTGIGEGPREYINSAFDWSGIRDPAKIRYGDR